MRSKILENQVRSGQLSSGHVFGQQATSPPLVWKGRGTQRHSRMCPLEFKMDAQLWIQQVTTRVGAVTCWIQQPVSPKQVVRFTCVFNSEVDQLMRKFTVASLLCAFQEGHPCKAKQDKAS